MKRTLIVVMLAALLFSTVGASVAVAKDNQPAGKSQVYQQSVIISNLDGTTGHGKFVLNMKQHTFTFTGEGCTPGVRYRLSYTSGYLLPLLGYAVADSDGNLRASGACQATPSDLASFSVEALHKTGSPPPSLGVTITAVDTTAFNGNWQLTAVVTGEPSSSITDYYWQRCYPNGDLQLGMSGPASIPYQLDPQYNGGYTMKVTVTDANGNTATSVPWLIPNV